MVDRGFLKITEDDRHWVLVVLVQTFSGAEAETEAETEIEHALLGWVIFLDQLEEFWR